MLLKIVVRHCIASTISLSVISGLGRLQLSPTPTSTARKPRKKYGADFFLGLVDFFAVS